MTSAQPDEADRRHGRDTDGPGRREEMIGRFVSAEAAAGAAQALRRAGYRVSVERVVWQPVDGGQGMALLPVAVGAALGTALGALLAAGWWALSGAFGAWNPAALPISRALGGVVIYLLCTLAGAWIGAQWRRAEEQDDATAEVGDARPRYAVAVWLPEGSGASVRHQVRRVLEEYNGREVEVRQAA